jgi:predicted DNA binding protein
MVKEMAKSNNAKHEMLLRKEQGPCFVKCFRDLSKKYELDISGWTLLQVLLKFSMLPKKDRRFLGNLKLCIRKNHVSQFRFPDCHFATIYEFLSNSYYNSKVYLGIEFEEFSKFFNFGGLNDMQLYSDHLIRMITPIAIQPMKPSSKIVQRELQSLYIECYNNDITVFYENVFKHESVKTVKREERILFMNKFTRYLIGVIKPTERRTKQECERYVSGLWVEAIREKIRESNYNRKVIEDTGYYCWIFFFCEELWQQLIETEWPIVDSITILHAMFYYMYLNEDPYKCNVVIESSIYFSQKGNFVHFTKESHEGSTKLQTKLFMLEWIRRVKRNEPDERIYGVLKVLMKWDEELIEHDTEKPVIDLHDFLEIFKEKLCMSFYRCMAPKFCVQAFKYRLPGVKVLGWAKLIKKNNLKKFQELTKCYYIVRNTPALCSINDVPVMFTKSYQPDLKPQIKKMAKQILSHVMKNPVYDFITTERGKEVTMYSKFSRLTKVERKDKEKVKSFVPIITGASSNFYLRAIEKTKDIRRKEDKKLDELMAKLEEIDKRIFSVSLKGENPEKSFIKLCNPKTDYNTTCKKVNSSYMAYMQKTKDSMHFAKQHFRSFFCLNEGTKIKTFKKSVSRSFIERSLNDDAKKSARHTLYLEKMKHNHEVIRTDSDYIALKYLIYKPHDADFINYCQNGVSFYEMKLEDFEIKDFITSYKNMEIKSFSYLSGQLFSRSRYRDNWKKNAIVVKTSEELPTVMKKLNEGEDSVYKLAEKTRLLKLLDEKYLRLSKFNIFKNAINHRIRSKLNIEKRTDKGVRDFINNHFSKNKTTRLKEESDLILAQDESFWGSITDDDDLALLSENHFIDFVRKKYMCEEYTITGELIKFTKPLSKNAQKRLAKKKIF